LVPITEQHAGRNQQKISLINSKLSFILI